MNKFIKDFKNYIKENYERNETKPTNNFAIGDLVWDKNVGQKGLVGLVVGEAKFDAEYEVWEQDVLFRGYSGDIINVDVEEIVDLLDSDMLYHAIEYTDISTYKNIASKRGITLNPKYEEAIEDRNSTEDDFISEDEPTTHADDVVDFCIPEWALPALINDDMSGLEDKDIEKINTFVAKTVEEFGNANFMLADEKDLYLGFRHSNDIDNLGANCEKLLLKATKGI